MKNIVITCRMNVTDDFYEKEIEAMKRDILCGKPQREIKDASEGGVTRVTMTIEATILQKDSLLRECQAKNEAAYVEKRFDITECQQENYG